MNQLISNTQFCHNNQVWIFEIFFDLEKISLDVLDRIESLGKSLGKSLKEIKSRTFSIGVQDALRNFLTVRTESSKSKSFLIFLTLKRKKATSYSEFFTKISSSIQTLGDFAELDISNLEITFPSIDPDLIPEGADEVKSYHPFFRKQIFKKLLLPNMDKNHRLQLCAPVKIYQKVIDEEEDKDFADLGFTEKFLQKKTPDLAFVPVNGLCSSFWLVVVGEIKTIVNTQFSPEEMGQIINYGCRILEEQPSRSFVWVFLTDCSHIQFFKLLKQGTGKVISILQSPVYNLWSSTESKSIAGEGMKKLFKLLTMSPKDLGYSQVDHRIENIQIHSLIGMGLTSHVYSVTTDPKLVLKV
jgi:hypothetical protein